MQSGRQTDKHTQTYVQTYRQADIARRYVSIYSAHCHEKQLNVCLVIIICIWKSITLYPYLINKSLERQRCLHYLHQSTNTATRTIYRVGVCIFQNGSLLCMSREIPSIYGRKKLLCASMLAAIIRAQFLEVLVPDTHTDTRTYSTNMWPWHETEDFLFVFSSLS